MDGDTSTDRDHRPHRGRRLRGVIGGAAIPRILTPRSASRAVRFANCFGELFIVLEDRLQEVPRIPSVPNPPGYRRPPSGPACDTLVRYPSAWSMASTSSAKLVAAEIPLNELEKFVPPPSAQCRAVSSSTPVSSSTASTTRFVPPDHSRRVEPLENRSSAFSK